MAMGCTLANCQMDGCVQLTEREASVCHAICTAEDPVTFTALKRSTSLHQEVLSRIIRRLMIHGLAKRVEGGYRGECGQ